MSVAYCYWRLYTVHQGGIEVHAANRQIYNQAPVDNSTGAFLFYVCVFFMHLQRYGYSREGFERAYTIIGGILSQQLLKVA